MDHILNIGAADADLAVGGRVKQPERLQTIEALRGLAALAVTWFHLTNQYHGGLARGSGAYGWLGVDAFFVISGFVIPYSLHSAGYQFGNFFRFVAKRMIRLEPPYLASIGLVIFLGFASNLAPGFRGQPQVTSTLGLAAHLLYLVPLTPYQWLNPVYWSLAYEFAFYLIVGLLFPLLWPRRLVFTLSAGFLILATRYVVVQTWDPQPLLFLYGITSARFFVGKDKLWEFALGVFAILIVMSVSGAALISVVGLATAAAIVWVRIPVWPPLRFLGIISYSLYLTHVPIGGRVINLGRRFIQGPWQELLLSVAALTVSLVCAWLFYRIVEVGSTRLSKRFSLQHVHLPAQSSF